MKFFLFLFPAFLVGHQIGDRLQYDADISGPNGRLTGIFEAHLTGYDSSTDSFKLVQAYYMDGKPPQIKESWVSSRDMRSQQDIDTLLENCKSDDDTDRSLEEIDQPAGRFKTCAEETYGEIKGSFWVGKVPIFGIVSQDRIYVNNKTRIILKLRRFNFSKGELQ